MPVPSLVTDLSTTQASNYPAGSDNVFPSLDDTLRALSAFIASIRDNSGNGWVSPYLPLAGGTVSGPATFSSTVALNGALSGTGLTTYLASPPAIGGTAPAAGSFTSLSASGTVSGTGFSNYLASPPAIGGTAAAAVSSTNLSYTGTLTGGTGVVALGTNQFYKDASGNVGLGTATPGAKLDVVGTAAISGAVTLSGGTANGVLYLNGSKVATSGSALTFDGNNMTQSGPNAAVTLQVNTANAGVSASNYSEIALSDVGAVRTYWRSLRDGSGATIFSGNDHIRYALGGTEQMRLTSTGLGIGTSAPGAKLDVVAQIRATGSSGNSFVQLDGGNADGASLRLSRAGSATQNAYFSQFQGTLFIKNLDSGPVVFTTTTSDTERARITSAGDVGIGTTAPQSKMEIRQTTGGSVVNALTLSNYVGASVGTGVALYFDPNGAGSLARAASIQSVQATSGNYADLRFFVSNSATPAEAARITSGGDLLVGATATGTNFDGKLNVAGRIHAKAASGTTSLHFVWNESTTGNNGFIDFGTEGTYTSRGGITYNRAGGLVAYNTVSDYRAKDIIGLVQDPGATIDALKVYEGVMKGAMQSRPMLIAHEAQAVAPYAVSGFKDEVNEDGTPKFQQMDVSSLVPLLLAEIQSLRARVAALEA